MTGGGNITKIMHFILLGFSDFPRIIVVLFVVFLVIYILTLTWNLSLLILIRMDSHLHTPMYFFLSNLSFMDICYVTSTAPKMLYDFFQERQTITLVGCAVQYFVFSTMGLSESCLMTAMAYDRYAAICTPLLYSSVMSPALCGRMVLGSYMAGLSATISQLCFMLQLQFCGPNVINHFFCDLPQLLVLSCTDTFFCATLDCHINNDLWDNKCLIYYDILCLHCHLHHEDHDSKRQVQGFQHLCFPSDSSHSLLYLKYLCLFEFQHWWFLQL